MITTLKLKPNPDYVTSYLVTEAERVILTKRN